VCTIHYRSIVISVIFNSRPLRLLPQSIIGRTRCIKYLNIIYSDYCSRGSIKKEFPRKSEIHASTSQIYRSTMSIVYITSNNNRIRSMELVMSEVVKTRINNKKISWATLGIREHIFRSHQKNVNAKSKNAMKTTFHFTVKTKKVNKFHVCGPDKVCRRDGLPFGDLLTEVYTLTTNLNWTQT